MPRLASLRIPGKQDLNFAILSKNWALSQKTKGPFVAHQDSEASLLGLGLSIGFRLLRLIFSA